MVRAVKGSPPSPTRHVREKPAESAIQDGGGRDLLLLRQYRLAVAGACRYLRSRYQPSMVRMCWPGSESAPVITRLAVNVIVGHGRCRSPRQRETMREPGRPGGANPRPSVAPYSRAGR
jgi:hypothetical protein